MTQKIRFIDPDKVLEANRDYLDRIESDGLFAVYDGTLDTLFLEIGGPKEALSEHVIDNIMLRVDPVSLQIVGLEILDFLSDFLPNNRLVEGMVSDLGLQEGQDKTLELMEPKYKPFKDVIEALIGMPLTTASSSMFVD